MPTSYLDTSGLVKRFRTETGSDRIEAIYQNGAHQLFTSYLTVLEARGAFARMRRDRQISNRLLQQWRDRLAIDVALRLVLVNLSDDVMSVGISLADKYGLKAADSIQLASAVLYPDYSSVKPTFITADRRLEEAARIEGFTVLNPNTA